MKISEIHGEFIKLSQWLKREDLISTGGEAKVLIEEEKIKVNGVIATEVRKKLRDGDVVEVEGQESVEIKVVED